LKPFFLSSETVLPIKPFYLSNATCTATPWWLRKERSEHSDLLEWEKGREVDFIASSVFFAKISSGASSFLRTRDIFLICENMSLFRQMSFFYGSGRGLSLAYNRPRVYASSQLF
jgi:hypothetical protein